MHESPSPARKTHLLCVRLQDVQEAGHDMINLSGSVEQASMHIGLSCSMIMHAVQIG